MLHEMGIETGVDLDALIGCANRMGEILGKELPGQVMKSPGPRSVPARNLICPSCATGATFRRSHCDRRRE